MTSPHYPHKVAAIYPDTGSIRSAIRKLDNADLGDVRITMLAPGESDAGSALEPETDATRDTLIKSSLAGGSAGGAAGMIATGVASLATPTLFAGAPVVGPLIVLGYGAMIGSTAGAIRGLKMRENLLAGMINDALMAGFHVIIVHAADERARLRSQTVLNDTIAEDIART